MILDATVTANLAGMIVMRANALHPLVVRDLPEGRLSRRTTVGPGPLLPVGVSDVTSAMTFVWSLARRSIDGKISVTTTANREKPLDTRVGNMLKLLQVDQGLT